MSEALVVGIVRQAIETAVMVTLPMLAAGLVQLGDASLALLRDFGRARDDVGARRSARRDEPLEVVVLGVECPQFAFDRAPAFDPSSNIGYDNAYGNPRGRYIYVSASYSSAALRPAPESDAAPPKA